MPIRDGTLRDVLFITNLDEECFNKYAGPNNLTAIKMMGDPEAKDVVVKIYTDDLIEGYPVGFAITKFMGDHSYISHLAVIPLRRGMGIGPKLLGASERRVFEIAGQGHMLELHVAEDNAPARKIFEKFGFEYKGRAPINYKNAVTPLRMIKFFKPTEKTIPPA
jgi:ribosomal protein S18 acetylase RimI-like enzyme